MATHSSIPAWQTPGKKSLQEKGACRLQSTGLQRVGHDWSNLAHSTRSWRVQTESRWTPPLCTDHSRTWCFTHVGASGLHQEGRQCVHTLPCHTWRSYSCVRLCATPWTAAHQAPLSRGFSRQEYWSGLSFPTPSLRSLECHNPIVFETRSTRK